MKPTCIKTIIVLFCVSLRANAQSPALESPGVAPQNSVGNQSANMPTTPGPVPPRDPRLKALKTQDSVRPPNVTTPAPPAGTPDVPQRPLSAEEAVRIALRLQPSILNARAGLFGQQGRTRQARSALLPQVTVAASYNRVTTLHGAHFAGAQAAGGNGTSSTGTTGTTTGGAGSTGSAGAGNSTSSTTTSTSTTSTSPAPSIGVVPGADVEGSLRQLIFDFDHTRNMVRQSKSLERAADQNVVRARSDTAFNVKQAFYQHVSDLQLVQVNDLEVTNRQAQLDLAQSRYNVGLGQPVDVYSAQTAKAEAILNLAVARDNAEQSRIALALAMGIDPRTPIVPASSQEAVVVGDDVNALVALSLRQRPEAIQAGETLRSSRYGVAAARTTNAPIISGEVNVISQGDQFVPQNDYLTVGISLSWYPVDGGLARGRVDEARANVLAAQSQQTAIELSIKADVSSAYVNMRSAEGRVAAAQADVANAEQNVDSAVIRYRTGIGQFVDIINAQAFLLTARTNLVTTQGLIPQYRAALARAIGTRITP